MVNYLLARFGYMITTLLLISVVSFIVIQLPPGDWLTSYIAQLEAQGQEVDDAEIAGLKALYGLDRPLWSQYGKWISGFFTGRMGVSFSFNRPVVDLIAERLPLTIMVSVFAFVFSYAVAIPIGIYSATHQYSPSDYFFTTLGFIGISVPNFLLGIIVLFGAFKWFGVDVGGLFSDRYVGEPWSFGKFLDFLTHIPVPMILIGAAGTATLIRVMRGTLLDELRQQYVITARAKGVTETALLFKYPVRLAINPIISTIGYLLPAIFSGQVITAVVLRLSTMGPMLLRALISQDMFLAGSIVLILSFLVVVGTLISDLLLVVVDPRIRYESSAELR